MFGSTSQKPGGFTFGSAGNTQNKLSTNTNNSSGFSFGNSNNTQQNIQTSNANSAPTLGGFSLNRPLQSTQVQTKQPTPGLGTGTGTGTSTSTSTGFSFGNTNNNATSTTKPSLFGNSSTNPSFGNTTSGLGFGQQQQQQMAIPNPSPYGVDFAKFAASEMPQPLTRPSDDSSLKVKRKRADSIASSIDDKNKNVSLVGRIVDTFKAPSKYSVEDVRGLFTSTRNISKHNSAAENSIHLNRKVQLDNYSESSRLDIPKIPASKSEYRRLIIKNPRDAFSNYDEIDANIVFLSKYKDFKPSSSGETNKPNTKKVIEDLKPSIKRFKTGDATSEIKHDFLASEYTEAEPTTNPKQSGQSNQTNSAVTEKESEYWCTPSIAELSKMSSLELTHVQNFTAGRKNHGHLMFKYPVDLTAFECKWDKLLGETIFFQNRILQVYHNEAEKPSQGNGLNVPAVITLENVFPKSYDPKNPDIDLLERHILRLKSTHGMEFISFDPSTGNYVFEVEHFSIWGIVDEEDDDPEIVTRWRKQQEMELTNEKRKNELQINALEKIAGYGQPGDNWKRQKPDFGVITPGSFIINGNGDEDQDEDVDANSHAEDNGKNQDIIDDIPMSDTLIPIEATASNDINYGNNHLALANAVSNDIDELVEIRAYEPEVKDVDMQFINPKTELSVSDNWDEQLHLSSGFFSVFNKNLDKQNNIKLDAKNVDRLIFGDKDSSMLKKAVVEAPLKFENSLQYQKCLQAEIMESEFTIRDNKLPQVGIDTNVSLKIPLLSFENSSDYNIWELLSLLYDDNYLISFFSKSLFKTCDNSLPKMKHILDIKRREHLCEFLQKIISLDVDNSFDSNILPRDTIDKIFHFICTDKIGDAIQYALNTKNNHIAVLITMMDSNDRTVQRIAQSQLKEWSKGSINFIPPSTLKIYKLLTADILSKEYIDHLRGLTWPVVLFLMVKYGDSNRPLSETIREFVHYAEETGISDLASCRIYYLLFKMVNSSKEVLGSFDVELQFLLMKHLKPFIQFSSDEFNLIIEEFSKKLEKKQMLEESIYVLEHLTNNNMIQLQLPKFINDHVESLGFLENNKKLQQLNNVLHIPYGVLHEARSFEFNRIGKYYKSTLELLLADNLVEAHKLMLDKVAPEIIISNVKADIQKLRVLVGEFSTLVESKIGAGVYGDYINAIELSENINFSDADYEIKREKLRGTLEGVLNGIASLVNTYPKVKIAKTIMLKKLISISFKEDLKHNPQQLLLLELPESERNYLEAKIEDDKLITN